MILALQWLLKLSVLLLGVLAAEAVKRLYRIVRRNTTLRRQFNGPKATSLVLGNLAECSWTPQRHRVILDWSNRYGLIFHARLVWLDVLVISDPAIAAEVLHNRKHDKVPEVYASVAKMMSDRGHPDLLSGLTDDWWRLFRKGLAPAFNPANIRAGFKCTNDASSELIAVLQKLGPDKSVDMDQACLCETMDVISRFAFGVDFSAVARFERGEVAELMDTMHKAELEVERRVSDPLREWTWWMTKDGRQQIEHFKRFQAIMRSLLFDMRERMGPEPPESDQSLGAYMLRLRHPETGKPLPDARLLPHIGMFFFAGHDTTGHTISWTLFHIVTHPEVEGKIVEELDAAGLLTTPQRPQPRALVHDDLAQLTYLGAACKESMRVSSVAGTVTVRITEEEGTLAGGKYFVPKGTCLWTPLYTIHNHNAIWPDADKFLPERWFEAGADYMQQGAAAGDGGDVNGRQAAGNNGGATNGSTGQDAAVAPGAHIADAAGSRARGYEMNIGRGKDVAKAAKRFIPFSDGRRDCIGQALAKMNYTAVLARLLSCFHFELAPEMGGIEGVRTSEHMAMTLQFHGGLRMLCKPRV